MNKFSFTFIFLLLTGICDAQDNWVTKDLFEKFEVSFPSEPYKYDLGATYNYMLRTDSAVYQVSQLIESETKQKSTYATCHTVLLGITAGAERKILQRDSVMIGKYCAIRFTVEPAAERLRHHLLRGFVIDMNGDVFMVMVNYSRIAVSPADRFIQSFRLF